MSSRTFSSSWPVCLASSILQLRAHPQDLAGLDLHVVAWPQPPSVDGWWIRIRALGSASRLPLVPAARITAAAEAAWPMQMV